MYREYSVKSSPKILNYSENNEIFVGGCFFSRTL